MSSNGLQNTNLIINTIDGLTNIWATDIYENGQKLSIEGLVPYTGANKTIDLNNQIIRSTHNPTNGADLVNLTTLTNAVTYVDTANAMTYLNKITATEQTVVAPTTFNSTVTSVGYYTNTGGYNFARPSASYNAWGITRIANGGQVKDLQFKDDTANQTTLLLSSTGQTVYVGLTCDYGTANKVPIWNADKKLVSSGVDSIKITYLDNVSSDIQTQLNGKASLAGGNSFSGLQNYSDKTSDTVAIFDGSKNLSSSVISTTELNYLGGLNSNIQTQLNGKLSLTGGSMTGNISMGFNNISSLYTPVNANDVVNKGYVDGAIGGAGSLYLLKTGGTMTGDIVLNGNKITSTATPTTNDTLTRKGYVDTQDALRLALTGGTLTGTVLNSAGDFHPYKGGDTNRGCILFANNQDGASYSNYNGGLASWFGIGFKSTLDSITRFMFDTRSGDSSQVGSITCAGLTSSTAVTVDATVNVGNRLLGTPDGSPGNFWMGLRGTGTEIQRLAIAINGATTTGIVSHVTISKLLYLSAYTANRALYLDGSQAVQASSTTGTELGYLSGVTSGVQGQIDAKAPYTYVDSQNNAQNTVIATKADTTYVDTQNNAQNTVIATKADTTYVDTQNNAQNTVIATKADTTYVDTQNNAQNTVIATKADTTYVNTQDAGLQTQINTLTVNQGLYLPKGGGTMTGQLGISGTNKIEFGVGVVGKDVNAGKMGYEVFNAGCLDIVGAGTSSTNRKVYIYDKLGVAVIPTETFEVAGTSGLAGQVSIGVSGNTVPNLKFSNNLNHITGNAAEAYLFNGQNGYIAVGRNTTRSATEANLHIGTTGTDASIESIASNGSLYLPLSYYASKHYFTGGNVLINSGYYLNCGNGNSTSDEGNKTQIAFGWHGDSTGYRHRITSEHNGGDGVTGNGNSLNFYLWSNVDTAGTLGTNHKMTIAGAGIGIGIKDPLCSLYNYGAGTTGWKGMSYFGNETTGVIAGTYDNQAYLGGHSGSLNAWTDVYLAPGGKVRVGGVTAPTYQLDVTGDIRSSGSLLFGTGAYEAGCIFSNADWGCIFRAKQNAPGIAHFLWATSDNTHLMRISPSGVLNFYGGATPYAVPNSLNTSAGALVIGAITMNYGSGWQAGLLMETSETTGIAVHDSGEKISSFMYYNTNNRFEMGKATEGYGTTPIDIQGDLYLGGTPITPATTSVEYQLSRDPFTDKCIWTPKKYVSIFDTLNVPKYLNWNGVQVFNCLYLNVASNILFQGFFTFYTDAVGQRYAYARLYHAASNTYYYPEATKFFNITGNHEVVPINQFFYNLPAGNYDLYMFGGGNVLVDGNDRAVFSAIVFS